jgi:predicted metalloprotease
MRWQRGHRSANVEDRRGARVGGRGLKLGCGGFVLLLVLSAVLGRDLITPLLGGEGLGGQEGGGAQSPEDQELVEFVSFVLDDNQAQWRQSFGDAGRQYPDAQMVIFSDAVDTACGAADSGVGPFYCPADQRVYIDLAFARELRSRFGAPGDFALAYVIAHEVGHHVQHVVGTNQRVRMLQRQEPSRENALSIQLELQADCYAGVWAHSTGQRQLLEEGDVEEAMRAAEAIGDDTLQRQANGRVQPETWTHGSSEQRMRWFREGYASGSMNACDTFRG